MKAKVALVLVVLVTAASMSTMFAKATHQNSKDGNDVKGRLDIRQVNTFGRVQNPDWKIITFARNTATELRDRGFFLVYLDTFGDSRFDYYALVSSNGSRVQGTLWRDPARKRDRKVRKLTVWRADNFSVSVRVPLSKLNTGGKNRLIYRWFVKSLFVGDNCRRVCLDRAPNNGAHTENNGRPTPSPTGTDNPELTEDPEANATPDVTESPSTSPQVTPAP